ncbi:unnamed protein product [Brassicogethes aeneus]|uniref:Uncharacterized protein n=1 Tax=Brassicogethes aeneus TaxID=1431903 RepID=A0A9P0FL43_BRAAE|nr:unnamed protein product [Brassicogethes aeneus]
MKIIVLISLAIWTVSVTTAEYPKYKIRGPPQSQRHSQQPQQYIKKWQQHGPPQRSQGGNNLRTRPIPVHMPPGHKIPMGIPIGNRPVAVPVRAFWKNTQQNKFNAPPENVFKQEKFVHQQHPLKQQSEASFTIHKQHEKTYIPSKDKPFLSSPTINNQENDFHIEANSIPTLANPIKQVGEKGPIHTIPAPRLGPKDKPASIEDVHTNYNFPETVVNIQKSHSYQVTEPNDQQINFYQQPQQYKNHQQHSEPVQHYKVQHHHVEHVEPTQQLYKVQHQQPGEHPEQMKLFHHQMHLQVQPQIEDQQQVFFSTDPIAQPQATFTNQKIPQLDLPNPHFSQKELFKLLQEQYPNENFEALKIPQPIPEHNIKPQQYYHQHQHQQQQQHQQEQISSDNFRSVLGQQIYQDPYRLAENEEDKSFEETEHKVNINPEMHSFNYEEESQDRNQGISTSLVTGGYNLDSDSEGSEPVQVSIGRNSDESEQSEYVQNFYKSNQDQDEENNVEPDAKPSNNPQVHEEVSEDLMSSSYYSSLPNKNAADSLAKLQTAGKVNNNLMKLSPSDIIKGKSPMKILIPELGEQKQEGTEESADYEEFSEEDLEMANQEANTHVFGHKIQPKN